jgi:hypothetical protein
MKKFYTIALLVLLIGFAYPQYIFAQTFTDQTAISLTGMTSGEVVWGDYDNDGDLDILMCGLDASFNRLTKIYRNNGDGTFSAQSITLPQTAGRAIWTDFNNDGYLDILICGDTPTGCIASIYQNNKDNTFSQLTNISLTGVCNPTISCGDYNNDGFLDIVLTGDINTGIVSKIYRNNGDNTFAEQTGIVLKNVEYGSVAWGDYDNDGFLDCLLTGIVKDGTGVSAIYHNNGDNTFTEQTAISLTPVRNGSVAWGDYDNDGYLDILLTGLGATASVTKIYHNNGNGTFSEQTSISLAAVEGSVAWGDYDNDGYLDILLTGTISAAVRATKIYHNNGNGSFTELTGNAFSNVDESSVAWGDYDNDGDLDILLTGYTGAGYISKIYRNNTISATPKTINNAPTAPANLGINSNVNGNVTFAWDKSTDTETPQKGLSYNLYVYQSGQSTYLRSPQAFSQTQTKNGTRLLANIGSIQYIASGYTLKGLASGIYKWSVQAVDGGLKGGPFSTEQSFNVLNLNKVDVNVANAQLIYTSPDIDYSFNSTDGSTGTWTPCTSVSTAVDFVKGGFDVWVREHASPSNVRKVATIAAQSTPTITIDYANEVTTQILGDTVEYSVNADLSNSLFGAASQITVTPGQNLYFRYKASKTRVITAIQTLTVIPRATLTFTVDFANETTNEIIPSSVEYSLKADLPTTSHGPGVKLPVTPGQNFYLRSMATSGSFKSNIQTLTVPARPATPAYTIDYINETTNELAVVTDEYSSNADFSNATNCTGAKAPVIPGQNLYFRTKATASSFKSLSYTLVVPARAASPYFTVDFVAETTNEVVGTSVQYSQNSTMNNAVIGNGAKLVLTPGQNIYFRTKATSIVFQSNIQNMLVDARPLAPTNPVVNDGENTFDWDNSINFPNAFEHEISTDNGVTWESIQYKPIAISNVNIATGAVQVRVKSIVSSRFKSDALLSNAPYTFNTGISNLNAVGIKMYPNPVNSILVLENIPEKTEASVWSADGKHIKNFQLMKNTNQLDVTNLPNGFYILKIQNDAINAEARFVKQ